jgi:hypothetical protein
LFLGAFSRVFVDLACRARPALLEKAKSSWLDRVTARRRCTEEKKKKI